MSGEFNRTETNGTIVAANNGESAPGSPIPNSASTAPPIPPTSAGNATAMPKNVEDVMYSDIGVSTLLNRLKQSIASARDFAAFLKKRSTLEEEQATGIKRLAKSQQESLRRAEVKMGSYAAQLMEVMRVHERMGENGMQFALSLHQMHEDLNELSNNMERGRKQWKHEGLDSEKRASDAEAAMSKAKSRYDTLAEDYDRARTGDTKGSRRIGLKGTRSAEQYEQDMLRKTQAADEEYGARVKQAKSQRETLLNSERPKAIKALSELIRECDSALTLQLQKFATFNEKLILGNGLAVTPLTDKDAPGSQRSLRDVVMEIDNETDFNSYVRGQKVPPRSSEIKYEQHPTLTPKQQKPSIPQDDRQMNPGWPQAVQVPLSLNTGAGGESQPGSATDRFANYSAGTPQSRPSGDYAQRPPTGGASGAPSLPPMLSYQPMSSPTNYLDRSNPSAAPTPAYSATAAGPGAGQGGGPGPAPPYPTHPSERSAGPFTPQHQQQPSLSSPMSGPAPRGPQQPYGQQQQQYNTPSPQIQNPPQHNLPPLRPVFGISLEELFTRDQTAVPQIVVQCILAVDTFGLDVEGIYRMSGTASHIQTLKSQFDHDSSRIDFRNPAAFMHDVNSVATLLKQFFRDLPDPLFTIVGYQGFIEAAKIENDELRRDALHQSINDLPDPNYATLRALVLHLWRVMGNEERNRMGSSNLAVCFAPSLMGTHTGPQIADAGLQARVLDTILVNATDIFEED